MDLLTEIFRRGGWKAAIVAAVASFCIWGLAHLAASPGTQVSVLWGLVQYTKMPIDKALSQDVRLLDKVDASPQPPRNEGAKLPPVESPRSPLIEVVHGVSSANDEAIRAARSSEGLRMLRPLEEGKNVADSPKGTYYFAIAPQTWSDNTFLATVERSPSTKSADFEFRHRKGDDGVALVAYAIENDANRLLDLKGDREFALVVAGEPWNDFTSMVEIPVIRIKSSKARSIDGGVRAILDLVVQ